MKRTNTLRSLPPSVTRALKLIYRPGYPIRQNILESWPIEQGALALASIKSGIKVRYLDESYNNWGGDEGFHILHCFKSVYKFNRRAMFTEDSEKWIEKYLESEIPGKKFLATIVREYKHKFHETAPS